MKLRNPWGYREYKGDWSDDSDRWTKKLRKEVDLKSEKRDGFFYMSIEDFTESFYASTVNYDTDGWFEDHFLMLDDDMSSAPLNDSCLGRCSAHKINITSDVDQDIWVSMHTWDKRSMPRQCHEDTESHYFVSE